MPLTKEPTEDKAFTKLTLIRIISKMGKKGRERKHLLEDEEGEGPKIR